MCPSTEKGAEARERREGGADPSSSKGPGPRGGAGELTPHPLTASPEMQIPKDETGGHDGCFLCSHGVCPTMKPKSI